jgi:hypothetical protein
MSLAILPHMADHGWHMEKFIARKIAERISAARRASFLVGGLPRLIISLPAFYFGVQTRLDL